LLPHVAPGFSNTVLHRSWALRTQPYDFLVAGAADYTTTLGAFLRGKQHSGVPTGTDAPLISLVSSGVALNNICACVQAAADASCTVRIGHRLHAAISFGLP
jgi:hypothetical protein